MLLRHGPATSRCLLRARHRGRIAAPACAPALRPQTRLAAKSRRRAPAGAPSPRPAFVRRCAASLFDRLAGLPLIWGDDPASGHPGTAARHPDDTRGAPPRPITDTPGPPRTPRSGTRLPHRPDGREPHLLGLKSAIPARQGRTRETRTPPVLQHRARHVRRDAAREAGESAGRRRPSGPSPSASPCPPPSGPPPSASPGPPPSACPVLLPRSLTPGSPGGPGSSGRSGRSGETPVAPAAPAAPATPAHGDARPGYPEPSEA